MNLRMISGLSVLAVIASPAAFASNWSEAKAACASALAAEAGVESAGYDVKLLKARDGATKRVTVELKASGQPVIAGECKLREGEVIEVVLGA